MQLVRWVKFNIAACRINLQAEFFFKIPAGWKEISADKAELSR